MILTESKERRFRQDYFCKGKGLCEGREEREEK